MNKPIEIRTKHTCNFNDVDMNGHMNSCRYFDYFTEHRFTAVRDQIGLSFFDFLKANIVFYLRSTTIDYLRPIAIDQKFTIRSHLSELSSQTCVVSCEMLDEKGQVASRCSMHLVGICPKTKKPAPWPEKLIARFFEQENL